MRLTIKEIVLYAILGAILFVSQVSLNFIPNVELVSLFTIIFTLVYGKKVVYSVCIFVLAEGLLYGFGTWWFGYIIIWPSLVFLTLILKERLRGRYLLLSIYSAVFGFVFGFLFAIPYLLIGDFTFAFVFWLRGLPFDLIHMVGNYFTMLFLGEVFYTTLVKLNKQYFKVSNA